MSAAADAASDAAADAASAAAGAASAAAGAASAAAAELRALYEAFDAETARVSPVCRASGRCCDFEAFGHTLFASRLEVDVLLADAPLNSFDPATGLCPFWKERRCTARTPRPLGCRAFFCDEAKTEEMQALHETFLRRVKDIHVRHGIPWRYAPLLRHLADALPPPPALPRGA